MSRTFKVTLDGVDYTCHPFNLGELEQIADYTGTMNASKAGFAILKLALARATPAVTEPEKIEATPTEFREAITAVMTGSGMKPPGEAAPATAAG